MKKFVVIQNTKYIVVKKEIMKQTYTQKLRNILNFETTTFVSNICDYEEGRYQSIRTFSKSYGNSL